MSRSRKSKPYSDRKGQVRIALYVPTPLFDAYRQSIDGQTTSQDLRRYMAERVEAELEQAA